jgi:hypothetical protein
MSHHKNEHIVCPNCGFSASHNYCAQCGQETHLHKETFIGLVVHFVAHYFHYDSKFWQTLKALLFKPGKLTLAYWEKKRNRYIPPISLYIFVSAVFFIFFFSFVVTPDWLKVNSDAEYDPNKTTEQRISDSLDKVRLTDVAKTIGIEDTSHVRSTTTVRSIDTPEEFQEFLDGVLHSIPKMFFFMIPLMAFVLKILYMRRKELYFVDHAVFSLHIHAFTFIALIIVFFPIPESSLQWVEHTTTGLQVAFIILMFLYLIAALRNVYKSSWFRSAVYGIVILTSYVLTAALLSVLYLVFFFLGHYT